MSDAIKSTPAPASMDDLYDRMSTLHRANVKMLELLRSILWAVLCIVILLLVRIH